MSEPPAPPGYGAPPPPPGPMHPAEERNWATAAHWSALVAAFFALAFLGPLLVMLVKGNDSPWVRRHAVESLNFQLSMLVYGIVGTIAAVVLIILTLGIGVLAVIPLALAFSAYWLIMTIIGAVRTSNGVDFRYPLTIRMVS